VSRGRGESGSVFSGSAGSPGGRRGRYLPLTIESKTRVKTLTSNPDSAPINPTRRAIRAECGTESSSQVVGLRGRYLTFNKSRPLWEYHPPLKAVDLVAFTKFRRRNQEFSPVKQPTSSRSFGLPDASLFWISFGRLRRADSMIWDWF